MHVDQSFRAEYLPFGEPLIDEDAIQEVVATLRSRWIGTGPRVRRFEKDFAAFTGATHARAVSSCTAALHLALKVAGVGSGSEVITTAMTFVATANAIIHAGAKPVLVDVERDTHNIDPDAVERAVTGKTKAVIGVDMAGRPCDVPALQRVARQHELIFIEDAAHAIGAAYAGQRVGSLADLTAFSFYPTKNMTTIEGGMVTTHSSEWAQAIEVFSMHGLSAGAWKRYSDAPIGHYEAVTAGFKYNMTDVQAAIGIRQLPRLEEWRKRRESIWERYDAAFEDIPVFTPSPPGPDILHARHLYTLLFDIDKLGQSRDEIRRALHHQNIGTGIHYVAVHLHPYYRQVLQARRGDFPNAEWISDRTLSLPLSPHLSDEDVEDVITAVRRATA